MSRYQYDPTTEELTLIAGNSYQKFIAPIESSPTKTSHAKGSYLIYGSVLYEVTTAISSGGTIVVYPTSGYNVKVAATLEEQIASVKQALSSEAITRAAADTALGARIDNIIAPSGEAPSAAEVTDARIGADGVTYASLGAAIRTQVGILESDLSQETDYLTDILNEGTTEPLLTYENGYRVADNIHKVTYQANSCVSNVFFAGEGSIIKIIGIASGQKCNLVSETLNTGYSTTDFSHEAWYSGLFTLVVKNTDDSNITPSDIAITVEIDDENSRIYQLEEKNAELESSIHLFSGVEEIDVINGGYINDYVSVGSAVSLTPVSNFSYGYAIVSCSENDLFTVTGAGGIAPMLWAFIDSSNKLISKTTENDQRKNFILKAPANTAKVIFNVKIAEPHALYKGITSANINSGNGLINLVAMGAKNGDDITALLQYAVTFAQAPCTIYLPSGTYEVSNEITWKSKISFKGDGIDQTIIKVTGGTCAFSGRNISDYTMEGFTIDGTPTSGLWVKGIFQKYITRVVYRNIKIINTGATGLGTDFISDSVLENIWCDNCGASGDLNVLPDGQTTAAGCSGIGIGTVNNRYNNETVNVINCFTNNCKQYGIFFENQTAQIAEGIGIKIIGCSAMGNRTGIGISGNDSALVIGCTAYANHHAGFAYDSGTMITESGNHALSGKRVKFIGCVASYSAIDIPSGYPEFRGQPNGCGFYIAHNYDGCEMIACTARKNKNHGLYIYDGITDLSIIGGTFSENDEDGIFIHGIVDKFKLHPSFIESNGAVGIEFDGQISHGTIKDIVVVGNVTGMKASASTTMESIIFGDNLVYDNTTNYDNVTP